MSNQVEHWILVLATLCAVSAPCQPPVDPIAVARSQLDAGKLEQSEAILRNFLITVPSSADAHFLLGYVLFRDRKPKESLAEFTAGAKFRHPRADELMVVASDYVLLSDFEDADKWYSQVVSEHADDAEAWYLLGRTKYNENEFAAAISSLEHALTLRPNYVEAENNIGLSWKELNNAEKARAAFEAAIEWQGSAPVDEQPFLNLGTLLADGGENEKAVPYLTKAVALSPKNPTVHEELGKVDFALHKMPEAQAELEQAIAIAPNTSALHYKLGQILLKEGLPDRAHQEFAICARLNSTHSSSKTPNPLSLEPRDPR